MWSRYLWLSSLGARQAGLGISVSATLLKSRHNTFSKMYTEWCTLGDSCADGNSLVKKEIRGKCPDRKATVT